MDWILAVGGGSVMDCSKAISMAAVSEKDVWDGFWAKKGVVDFEPMPLGVIVTASGTGSESNGGAVITNEEGHDKDRPGLSEMQSGICINGSDLHLYCSDKTDGGRKL